MYDIAKRLTMARFKSGLSMQELADKSDIVTKQAINKYEKGLMAPSMNVLIKLCETLNVKVDYFLRENTLELGEIKYRKQSRLSKKKQKEIAEKTRDFLERYFETEELLGDHSTFKEELRLIKIQENSDAEMAAEKVRTEWNLGNTPLYNILEILEEKGVRVLHIDEEIKHFSGMSTWVNGSIPVIVLGAMNIDRLRFTALHELGHLVLDILHFDDKEQERICDRFAGAMLLPNEVLLNQLGGIRKRVHLRELCLIKSEFGISPQAILYRSRQLGYIPERFFTSQTKYLRMKGLWHKEIGTYKGEEKSNRLFQLVFRGIAEEYITSSKAASLLDITISELRREINKIDGPSN